MIVGFVLEGRKDDVEGESQPIVNGMRRRLGEEKEKELKAGELLEEWVRSWESACEMVEGDRKGVRSIYPLVTSVLWVSIRPPFNVPIVALSIVVCCFGNTPLVPDFAFTPCAFR